MTLPDDVVERCRHCNEPMRLEVFKGQHIDGEAGLWICSQNAVFGGLCRSNVAYLDRALLSTIRAV